MESKKKSFLKNEKITLVRISILGVYFIYAFVDFSIRAFSKEATLSLLIGGLLLGLIIFPEIIIAIYDVIYRAIFKKKRNKLL